MKQKAAMELLGFGIRWNKSRLLDQPLRLNALFKCLPATISAFFAYEHAKA